MPAPRQPPSHDGLRCYRHNPVRLRLGHTMTATCDRHGTDLEPVYSFEGLTLRDGSEVLACPWCFGTGGDVDTESVADVIADTWDTYSRHFKESDPPASDSLPPQFEFR